MAKKRIAADAASLNSHLDRLFDDIYPHGETARREAEIRHELDHTKVLREFAEDVS